MATVSYNQFYHDTKKKIKYILTIIKGSSCECYMPHYELNDCFDLILWLCLQHVDITPWQLIMDVLVDMLNNYPWYFTGHLYRHEY